METILDLKNHWTLRIANQERTGTHAPATIADLRDDVNPNPRIRQAARAGLPLAQSSAPRRVPRSTATRMPLLSLSTEHGPRHRKEASKPPCAVGFRSARAVRRAEEQNARA